MIWDVEYTDEFGDWWAELTEFQQEDVTAVVELLGDHGPRLPFPYSSGIGSSRYSHMRVGSRAVADRFASSTHSIRGGRQFC